MSGHAGSGASFWALAAVAAVAVAGSCADTPGTTDPSTSSTTGSGPATGGGGEAQGGGDPGVGGAGGSIPMPDPLGPLAAVAATSTDRFETSRACNQCHFGGSGDVMSDPVTGEDLSPGYQWRSSMMAFAARDPYYLAVVSEELEHAGGEGRRAVEEACLRCHAPAGSEESRGQGEHLGFGHVLTGNAPAANLGRDGVTCSLCHQIEPEGLGEEGSFSGGFTVGDDRLIYGPHSSPNTQPMQFFLEYTPTYSAHVLESSLCASCHTVITPAAGGGEFLEQAPFLEWQNSEHAGSSSCGTCHMPSVDSTGTSIQTPIATYPEGLPTRTRYGVHSFEGANAYVLSLLADEVEWTGSGIPAEELLASAERSRRHLATAARVEVGSFVAEGDALLASVTVHNQTGHKLPTGYPGRRLWIHLRALDAAGDVVHESGAWDADGRIVGADGAPIDGGDVLTPHRDLVEPGEVQIWEAVPGDVDGRPTHRPLAAARYLKDDRILPRGWSATGPHASRTAAVGVDGDASFVGGSDEVTFRVPRGADVARVEVELVYQTLPPAAADHLARVPTPAAVKFSQMVAARRPEVILVATASQDR